MIREMKKYIIAQLLGILLLAVPGIRTAWGVEIVEGEIGPGSVYGLFVPEGWNGDLALYAHGFVNPMAPIALPTAAQIEPLRDALLEMGYAVAYSSYSENGWAVADGVRRTRQLRGIFTSRFGDPNRTYLVAHSMGTMVAVKLAERNAAHYDGMLAMCGVMGGFQTGIEYVSDVRVLFDALYPGVLPGDLENVPPGLDFNNDVVIPIVTAISTDPTGAAAISMLDQTPVPWSTPEQLVESIITPIGFAIQEANDALDRTHGHSFFDNSQVVYSGPLPPTLLAGINAWVGRYETTPDAENYIERNYLPSGEIRFPVITLHTDQDPLLPLFHEEIYAETVEQAGNSDLLVQRTVVRYGHCTFTIDEMVAAFLDLADWVESGVRPSD
jgi:pimeloyl-ACP methyl ester carboxylesterase